MRPMTMLRLGWTNAALAAAGVLVMSACSGPSSGASQSPPVPTAAEQSAAALCRSAVTSSDTLVKAHGVTVADVRGFFVGPSAPKHSVFVDAWPGTPASAQAAWCDIKTGNTYSTYVVTSVGDPIWYAKSVSEPSLGPDGVPVVL